jgi:hypothetical protein
LGSGWDNNKSDAMHWEYLSFVIPLKSILIWCCLLYYIFYTPWTFVSIWCSNKFEKCQEFSYGPKVTFFFVLRQSLKSLICLSLLIEIIIYISKRTSTFRKMLCNVISTNESYRVKMYVKIHPPGSSW